MNPVHAAWALSAAGAMIFILLGYLIYGLKRSLQRDRAGSGTTRDEYEELTELLNAAKARVEVLEHTIAEERMLAEKREKQTESAAAAQVTRLAKEATEDRDEALGRALNEERMLADERERQAKTAAATQVTRLAKEAMATMKQKIVELEEALKEEKATVVEAKGQIAELEEALGKMKEQLTGAWTDLKRQRQKARALESEQERTKIELAEERKTTKKAVTQWQLLKVQLESVKSHKSTDGGRTREFELARKVRGVTERSWPQYEKAEETPEPSTTPPTRDADED